MWTSIRTAKARSVTRWDACSAPHALWRPEEFELGALIDEQTNVFVMGRTALVFLSDGTLNSDAFHGTSARFEVVARACEPERSRRYDSMAAFYRAWRDARTS